MVGTGSKPDAVKTRTLVGTGSKPDAAKTFTLVGINYRVETGAVETHTLGHRDGHGQNYDSISTGRDADTARNLMGTERDAVTARTLMGSGRDAVTIALRWVESGAPSKIVPTLATKTER